MKKSLILLIMFLLISSPALSQGQKAEEITINFVDVDLPTLVRVMSEITGKNFIFDESLRGKVTIIAPAKISSEEAFSLFVSALELKNFTVLPLDGAFKIIPTSKVRQSGMKVVKDGVRIDETYMVRLIPLKYISSQEALPFVQPYVSRNGHVSAFGSRNALVVVDTALNIEKILNILSAVDKEAEWIEPEVVYLRHAKAEEIARILNEGVRRARDRKGKPGQKMAISGTIFPDPRLNAIVLTGPANEREYLKRFISLLDVPPPERSSRINVYYLENADAEELAGVLKELTSPTPSVKAPPVHLPKELMGSISITPHRATNSLIILASPADFQNLVQVIKKLDRRPKQVFVEAMITEVSIDKALELGNRWRITAEKGGEPVAIGGVGTVDSSTIQSILNGLAGLSVGGVGNFLTVPVTTPDGSTFNLTAPGFAALFSLTEFRDVVNVLSTPHILTSDNTEAEIIVGENVPFLSKFERETTTTGQPLIQSIERKDVGITLRIKPKISEGNYVKLDIYQEISAVSPTTTAAATDLVTTKRSARTTVVVKNDQTVVIGGLIQDKEVRNITKVPLLGDIPILGWLFKYRTRQKQKTNLLVFITPHIVEDFRDLDRLREHKQKEFWQEGSTKERTEDGEGKE